jgi:hypothetical protein
MSVLPPRNSLTEVDFDEISTPRLSLIELDRAVPWFWSRAVEVVTVQLSPTLTTGAVRKSGVEGSTRLPGGLYEDSEDEFEPPLNLSTVPITLREPPLSTRGGGPLYPKEQERRKNIVVLVR